MIVTIDRYFRMLICLVVLFQLIVSPAWGLTNEENFAQFQFNFNTPGARAVGLGGAFISIADDATASEANPAGLVILERPEVSAEIKIINTKTDVPFSSTGLFDPDITVIQKEFDETAASPSFFSFTYPLERIAFAIYRQEILRFKQEFETQGAIVPGSTHIDSTTGVLTSNRLRPVQSETEIDIVNFGISLAYKITNTFSTGISLRFSRMDIDSNLSRFDVGPFLESPASFSEQNRRFTPIVNDSETGNSVNIGLLWRPDSKLSFGAVYRKGPEFTSLWMLTPGPVLPDVSTRFEDFTLKVPDSYGFGISYRPTNALTIGFDLVRIEYSDLLKNFQTPLEGAFGVTFPDDYELDDGTEVHLGAEYVFVVQSIPLAIRGGIFRDPDHRIRFNGPDPDIRLLFPEGDDEIHITFGGGIVPKDNFQIDVAGNISENIKEFIISSVYRF